MVMDCNGLQWIAVVSKQAQFKADSSFVLAYDTECIVYSA